jgi:hypothetical protein
MADQRERGLKKKRKPRFYSKCQPTGLRWGSWRGPGKQSETKKQGIPEWNKAGLMNMLFLLWWSAEVKRNYSQLHALATMKALWGGSLSK